MAMFFNRGSKPAAAAAAAAKPDVEVQFDKLLQTAATTDDSLSPQHLVALAGTLGIHEDDIVLYVLAWKLQCKTPMKISRDEWVRGLLGMRIDTMEKLKVAVPVLRNELKTSTNFRNFYNFVFDWVRESPQAKYVSTETACVMWPLIFEGRGFPHLKLWLEFFSSVYKKTVSRDLWRQTFDFAQISLESYDPSSSWPTAMDEFVEWQKSRK